MSTAYQSGGNRAVSGLRSEPEYRVFVRLRGDSAEWV